MGFGYRTIEDALTSGSGIERTFHCGNPDHHDRNASASVNSISGAFICYSCGWRGIVDVETFELDVSEVSRFIAATVAALEHEGVTYTDAWLSAFDATGPGEYWLSRFDAETCKHFRLGYDVVKNQPVIPLRSLSGTPLGVVRRNMDGAGTKYLYPQDSGISQTLFNYDGCSSDVLVITEGATDAIAAWEVGADAMAVYGSNMSRAQRVAISKYAPKALILAFDMDEAGDRAAANVSKMFPELLTYRARWGKSKDLASLPKLRRSFVLKAAEIHVRKVLAQACSVVLTSAS